MPSPMLAAALCLALSLLPDVRIQEPDPAPRASHVLLISMDVTRRDRLGFHGGPARTPNLDALAAAGVVFEHALAPTPVTLPSHATLLTGTYPPRHGVRDNGTFRLAPGSATLAGTLRAAGLRTGAVVSAFVLDAQFGLDQGFESYDDRFQTGLGGMLGREERSATATTDAALRWLDVRGDGAFFLFVHYFDPHHPYAPPEPFASQADHPYDGEIAYMDAQIGRLLEGLRQRELLDTTLVIATADHGESLGEHGEETHGIFVYQSTLAVPLVLRGPGLPAGRRVAGEVSLADVTPTVLDLLGHPIGAHVQGRSLVQALDGDPQVPTRPIYLEAHSGAHSFGWAPLTALVQDHHKFIAAPRPELYDLRADPRETRNLVEQDPERVRTMGERLAALARELGAGSASAPAAAPLADEDRRRLEALGYTPSAPRADGEVGLDPKDGLAEFVLLQRAGAMQEENRLSEAVELYDRILERNPRNWTALERSGLALLHLGRFDAAVERLERAPLFPGLPMYGLAQAHARLGNIERALQILGDVRRRNPKFMPAHLFFATYHEAQGEVAEALEAYRVLLENWHGDPEYRSRIERRVRELRGEPLK